jgi:hypothetical protein
MPIASRINQLRSNPNTVAGWLDASFHDVRHAKLIGNLTQVPLHPGFVLHD